MSRRDASGRLDLTDQRFGLLVAIERIDDGRPVTSWRFRCDCGAEHVARLGNVRSGNTMSCGCAKRTNRAAVTHGGTHGDRDPLYGKWLAMKQRCYYPKHNRYRWYGARGIGLCEDWRHDFAAFRSWATDSGYKPGLSIDRIDPDGDYAPENCRWRTVSENSRDKRPPDSVTKRQPYTYRTRIRGKRA